MRNPHLGAPFLQRPRRREVFATQILMLANHNTLDTFSVTIAGEPFTIQWACQVLGIHPPGNSASALGIHQAEQHAFSVLTSNMRSEPYAHAADTTIEPDW